MSSTQNRATNVTWHAGKITRKDRETRNNHKGIVVWFTGLSGSGKSTIAVEVERSLFDKGIQTYILDGDNVRHGLNKNLGFSPEDREENIRRIGEVAKLFADAGMIVITSFISPYRKDRDAARSLMAEGEFIEAYVKADVETCTQRDPKGLYKKALAGEIPQFTGISAPYEIPDNPELIVETEGKSVEESSRQVVDFLLQRGLIS